MKRINHHLTEKQIKTLKNLSKKSGLSASELIRRALDEYFDKINAANQISNTTKPSDSNKNQNN